MVEGWLCPGTRPRGRLGWLLPTDSRTQRGIATTPVVRVIAVLADAAINDVRNVDEIPRVGDMIDVNGDPMKVRGVINAEPGIGVDAFVYVTPIANGRH